MHVQDVIEKIRSVMAPGRMPSFTEAHVIKALEIIAEARVIGRKKLSKRLELGEGVTRTLIRHLQESMIIWISKSGITLSNYGKTIISELQSKISRGIEIPPSTLAIGPVDIAILVKNMASQVNRGLEQRDVAIKAGASGATTLVFSENQLIMPSVEETKFSPEFLKLRNHLVSKFGPKENDVIIIGSGETRMTAEIGAKMAALKLLKKQE